MKGREMRYTVGAGRTAVRGLTAALAVVTWWCGDGLVAQEATTEAEVRIEQVAPDAGRAPSPADADRPDGETTPTLPAGPVGAVVAAALEGTAGPGNTAALEQLGSGHRARVRQRGRGNVAGIVEAGAGHRVRVLQVGDGNVVGAWLHGVDDALSVEQRGDDNVYLLRFRGDGLRHRVVQKGAGLVAVQLGVGRVPVGIEQRGTGAAVRVTHGWAAPHGADRGDAGTGKGGHR